MAASLPLRKLPIHAFEGDAESSESLTLVQAHSTGGSKNVWLDTYGAVGSIAGYTRQNQAAVTAGVGPLALVGLYNYSLYQLVGGVLRNTQQIIGVFHGTYDYGGGLPITPYQRIYKSDDGGVTWTVISTGPYASGYTDIVLDVPHFAQIGDALIITGPTRTPLRWDGTTMTAVTTTQTITAPTVVAAGGGGKLGNYRFRVVPRLTDGTRMAPFPTTAVITLVNQSAAVTWTAYVNPLLKSYEVYSTTGTESVFFFEGDVDATTLTFTCALTDLQLAFNRVLQEHGDAPPYAALSMLHKDRMWYGQIFSANGDPTYPRKWFYSDPGRPDSVYQDVAYFDFSDGQSLGDQSTGGTGDFNNMAVFWLEQSIWTVSGTGRYIGPVIDYDKKRTKARVGTVTSRSVLRIPAGAKFKNEKSELQVLETGMLAYFTPTLDIRLFDGDNDIIISFPVNTTLKRTTYSARRQVVAVLDDSRSEATWIFPADGSTTNTLAVTWNFRHGVWYHREWRFGAALAYATRDNATVLIAGEADNTIGGLCYLLWNGRSFDGESFVSQWMSKTLYGLARAGEMEQSGELFTNTKRFRWLECLFGLTGPVDIEVAWLPYEAADDDDPVAFTIIHPGGPIAVASVFDTPLVSSGGSAITAWRTRGGAIARALLMDANGQYYHDRGLRLRIRAVTEA